MVSVSEEKTLLEFETDYFGIKGNKEGVLKIPKEHYTLTNKRILIRKQGVMTKTLNDIELFKVKDISVNQTLTDKVRNVGDIIVISANESNRRITLKKVKNPHEVKEEIRSAAKAATEKAGISYKYDL